MNIEEEMKEVDVSHLEDLSLEERVKRLEETVRKLAMIVNHNAKCSLLNRKIILVEGMPDWNEETFEYNQEKGGQSMERTESYIETILERLSEDE